MPDLPVLLVLEPSESSQSLARALQQAIDQDELGRSSVRLVTLPELAWLGALPLENQQICALTLDLPDWLTFPAQTVYRRCREPGVLRQQVQQWGYAVGEGNLWLPIVLTARGILFGEAIVQENQHYRQPVPLSDRWRQPLYSLGFRLLRSLAALPAVYLMQFGLQEDSQDQICFDRLWPFPAAPAMASLSVQIPDLFTCHWRCITGKPLRDLLIPGTAIAKEG